MKNDQNMNLSLEEKRTHDEVWKVTDGAARAADSDCVLGRASRRNCSQRKRSKCENCPKHYGGIGSVNAKNRRAFKLRSFNLEERRETGYAVAAMGKDETERRRSIQAFVLL